MAENISLSVTSMSLLNKVYKQMGLLIMVSKSSNHAELPQNRTVIDSERFLAKTYTNHRAEVRKCLGVHPGATVRHF